MWEMLIRMFLSLYLSVPISLSPYQSLQCLAGANFYPYIAASMVQ